MGKVTKTRTGFTNRLSKERTRAKISVAVMDLISIPGIIKAEKATAKAVIRILTRKFIVRKEKLTRQRKP